jgi:uncharacterized protein
MRYTLVFKKIQDIWQRFSGTGVCPHELSFILETPLRNLIISPEQLADRLHLSPDSTVLELGPGPGFFCVEVARRIPGGKLVLFDIQREMVTKSRANLRRSGAENCHPVQGNALSLPFSSHTFDVVFLVTVLGEVPQPEQSVKNISRVLLPGGLLSITEQKGDPDALSPGQLA